MSDSSDEETWGTPPELSEAAEQFRNNLLPTKSRGKYEKVYKIFLEWKASKKVKNISENVMLAYFSELAKKYNPSSLWATYSMLRRTININDKINIESFKQLLAFLKRQSAGFKSKKSKVFTAAEMKTFLDTAPDDEYLVTKVVLIFGICGACRGAELTNLTVDDIRTCGDVMVVKLRDTKNKTTRNFTVEGEFLKKVLAYEALRPQNMKTNRYFVNYRNGRCTKQVIGNNKLGAMAKEIATFLKLPDPQLYTGHSFRRSAATLCADGGADITEIKRLGGWKSTTVAEGYIEESIEYKRKTGQQISDAIGMASTSFEALDLEPPPKRQKIDKTDVNDNNFVSISQSTSTPAIHENLSAVSRKGSVIFNISNCSDLKFKITN